MFEIFIRPELYAKISYLFRKSDLEVGALLECYNEGNAFIVEDMFITKQEVSAGSVDFDEEAVDMLLLECMDTNAQITGWLHSHNSMASFWSGTDDGTIKRLNEHMDNWVLSIVGNKKMELVGRIDYVSNTPFGKSNIRVDDVPIFTLPEIDDIGMQEIDAVVKKNVTQKVITSYRYPGTYDKGKYSKGKYSKGKYSKQEPLYDGMTEDELLSSFGLTPAEYNSGGMNRKGDPDTFELEAADIDINSLTAAQWVEHCKLMEEI